MYTIRVRSFLSRFLSAEFKRLECYRNGKKTHRLAVTLPLEGTSYILHLQALCRVKECSAWLDDHQCRECLVAGRSITNPYNHGLLRVGLPFDPQNIPPRQDQGTARITYDAIEQAAGRGIVDIKKLLCLPEDMLPFERLSILLKPSNARGFISLQAVCPTRWCNSWLGDFLEETGTHVPPDDKQFNVWCKICASAHQVRHVLLGAPFDNHEPPPDGAGNPVSVESAE